VIGTALETALENAYIQLSNPLTPGQAEEIEALLVLATPPERDDANGLRDFQGVNVLIFTILNVAQNVAAFGFRV
jgi:hypothetical protein